MALQGFRNSGCVKRPLRENFTGVLVPFFEHQLHADTLPQFRAMNAALAARS
jgi:hypothetical protein